MASQNPFLANWLKGAYGMELGLAPMLEQQAEKLDDDTELHKSLNMHLEKTRRHASLLRERLQHMGEDVSSVRPIDPVTKSIGHVDGAKIDRARQTELLDYVTESFEVASYLGLQSLAEILGDRETSRVCEQILADEQAMTDVLSRRIPAAHNGHNGHNGNGAQATEVQGNVAATREAFAALNAHDLNRFEKLVGRDYRSEMPGERRPVDWAGARAMLENLMTAFPDLHYELERIASTGDTVFSEWTATGTHTAPFRIPQGQTIPATNKKVEFSGVTVERFQNDKLVHSRIITDTGNLMRQIGAEPGAAAGTATAPAPFEGVGRGIVHIEIPAIDRQEAARFYNELFGWEYEHMDDPVNYTTFQSGTMAGGFPDVSEMNPVGEVLFYVYSDDIESDLRQAENLGGKTVVPRTEIPGYGYFAVLSDPSGNHFGLYYTEQSA
jgi:uncharacterized protein